MIKKLQKKYNASVERAQALKLVAGDDPTEEQMTALAAEIETAEGLKAQIATAQKVQAGLDSFDTDALDEGQSRTAGDVGETVVSAIESDPMAGFSRPSDFFEAVRRQAMGEISVADDERLQFLAVVGSDEQRGNSNPDGGFLVPAQMQPGHLSINPEADPTVGRTNMIPMGSPIVKINARVDKDHSTSVSGGTVVYRRNETGKIKDSKIAFEQIKLEANSLSGLNYVTQELLDDSPESVAAIIANSFTEAFQSKKFEEKLNGTGVGQFLGITNADCFIQGDRAAADELSYLDVLNMRKRCYGYGNAIWMANHDSMTEIAQLRILDSNGNIGTPAYLPSMNEDLPDMLLGRPIFWSEYVNELGDANGDDLLLGDWSQYLEGNKGGTETAESIHVRFDYSEKAFRFVQRNDARPWWATALIPKKGSTKSPFVGIKAS